MEKENKPVEGNQTQSKKLNIDQETKPVENETKPGE